MMDPKNPLTPGVYIQELNAFPNSAVQVATSVPVFIGYTQKADYNGENLHNKPVQVSSLTDYINFFGGLPQYQFGVNVVADGINADVELNGTRYKLSVAQNTLFYLYNSIQLYYANGGGTCYIVSVGDYSGGVSYDALNNGLDISSKQSDITLVVIPDALLLQFDEYAKICQNMLTACKGTQNRFALFDIKGGETFTNPADLANDGNIVSQFRNAIGTINLNYGAAYFPWLQTGVVQFSEIDASCFDSSINNILNAGTDAKLKSELTNTLLKAIVQFLNVLPPAPAMAGVYNAVDNNRGVWKAPANVTLNSVINPLCNINDADQAGLNVDALSGKSINAIRTFKGMGVLVWGARTLDGNSQDWRYINVRRTMMMIEQSLKLAARTYVFESNDANTWVTVKSMFDNFLVNLWKQGALAGAVPEQAYSVSVGLGSTMTANDILDGIMRVSILVAISHPSEFIEITFQQQMQQS